MHAKIGCCVLLLLTVVSAEFQWSSFHFPAARYSTGELSFAKDRFFSQGYSSVNGSTWLKLDTNVFNEIIPGKVIYSGKQFVAIGHIEVEGDNPHYLLFSSDGISWEKRLFIDSTKKVNDIVWDGNKFIAVGHMLSMSNIQYAQIFTSSDGIAWVERIALPTQGGINSVAFGGNGYVAAGRLTMSGEALIYTSANGIDWQKVAFTLAPIIYNLQYIKGAYYGLAYSPFPPIIVSSSDGVSWIKTTAPAKPIRGGFAWDGAQFIVGGNLRDSSFCYTSHDCKTWQSNYIPGDFEIEQISYGNNMVVAIGNNFWGEITQLVYIGRPTSSTAYRPLKIKNNTILKLSKNIITYTIFEASIVKLTLFNMQGRLVQTLVHNEFKPVGNHTINLTPFNILPGMYIVSLKTGQHVENKTLVITSAR